MMDYSTLSKEELIKKLKDAEAELDIIVDNMPGGFISYNADTKKFEKISKGALAIFHCSEDEFRDRFYNNFELMISKDDREKSLESIDTQLQFFDTVELVYRVNDMVNPVETWIYHKARLVKHDDGSKSFYVVLNDVTEEKMVQASLNDLTEQLFEEVEKDKMTGLYNKESMQKEIKNYLLSNNRTPGAMFMIDTDNFKSVNDTFGHSYGDDIIKFVANAIDICFRSDDLKGRMGGDEFMVLMKNANRQIVEERARQLNDKIRRTCIKDGKKVDISCSIGIAFFPKDGLGFEDLYKAADSALYVAKESGKDQYRVY